MAQVGHELVTCCIRVLELQLCSTLGFLTLLPNQMPHHRFVCYLKLSLYFVVVISPLPLLLLFETESPYMVLTGLVLTT